MAIYHNQNLGALFNDIIGYLPTYFQTVTNMERSLTKVRLEMTPTTLSLEAITGATALATSRRILLRD